MHAGAKAESSSLFSLRLRDFASFPFENGIAKSFNAKTQRRRAAKPEQEFNPCTQEQKLNPVLSFLCVFATLRLFHLKMVSRRVSTQRRKDAEPQSPNKNLIHARRSKS